MWILSASSQGIGDCAFMYTGCTLYVQWVKSAAEYAEYSRVGLWYSLDLGLVLPPHCFLEDIKVGRKVAYIYHL